jgi:acyl dehydratase
VHLSGSSSSLSFPLPALRVSSMVMDASLKKDYGVQSSAVVQEYEKGRVASKTWVWVYHSCNNVYFGINGDSASIHVEADLEANQRHDGWVSV